MKTLLVAWLVLGAAPFKEAEPGLLAQAKVKLEVAIDAMTGAVVEHTHETPEDEANEAAKDKGK